MEALTCPEWVTEVSDSQVTNSRKVLFNHLLGEIECCHYSCNDFYLVKSYNETVDKNCANFTFLFIKPIL